MEYPSLDTPTAGATRFNTDSSQLEIYDGNQWAEVLATSPELQTGGTRGLYAGGTSSDVIDYVNIASTGNATDFGNLTKDRAESGGFSNRNRALWGGDSVPGSDNTIDYVTIASTGNAADFGDLTSARRDIAACSSSTRGVWCGGDTPTLVNTIDYVEILTTGNAVDFGDQTVKRDRVAGCSNAHGGL